MAHYFPYEVKLRLLAHSRSSLANQKAKNAIVGAENLLKYIIQSILYQLLLQQEMSSLRSDNARLSSERKDALKVCSDLLVIITLIRDVIFTADLFGSAACGNM